MILLVTGWKEWLGQRIPWAPLKQGAELGPAPPPQLLFLSLWSLSGSEMSGRLSFPGLEGKLTSLTGTRHKHAHDLSTATKGQEPHSLN